MFILQNKQDLKRFQRAARVRDGRTKRGCKGSRFAFLDLRKRAASAALAKHGSAVLVFAVSLAISTNQINRLYLRQGAE